VRHIDVLEGGTRVSGVSSMNAHKCCVHAHICICGSELYCVAMCCSVLRCVAVCCGVLQWVAFSYTHVSYEYTHDSRMSCMNVHA